MEPTKHPVVTGWRRGEPLEQLISREWLVTNGYGGYSSGTLGGVCTRRFHGLLIAALPAPLARSMMFNNLEEWLTLPDGRKWRLSGDDVAGGEKVSYPEPDFLEEFLLEHGTPVWKYSKENIRIEKRIVMPHLQNTTYVIYRLLDGPEGVALNLRPALHFRPHEGLLSSPITDTWTVETHGEHGFEISDHRDYPTLRLYLLGTDPRLDRDEKEVQHVLYSLEKSRGYESEGPLWSPGVIRIDMKKDEDCGFITSVEKWEIVTALSVEEAFDSESSRRAKLLQIAGDNGNDDFLAQLVLAADQFLIHPHTRIVDEARAYAAGESPRTIIAGYHWFTDWGRDTMISLEGLTLDTGRHREAGRILRTFASYMRDGLIPNMFPEGEQSGLYHTADATLWFFHALYRYVHSANDSETLRVILPHLVDIIDHHIAGTRFNIKVDPNDGLLSQGEFGYQLTWMDAKVEEWVVTPRRGKAVEINALWYNALRILETFLRDHGDQESAERMNRYATRTYDSFNRCFWYDEGQYLYDVVDKEGGGNDTCLRPNQIFSISLDFPVLEQSRWKRVLQVVKDALLTPYGLRSLSRDNPEYKATYDGDRRARDAAYHQGTVWAWLIGPFIDAWLKVHPGDNDSVTSFLEPFRRQLGDGCIGTIAEIFDAEPPFHPRGCAAQAWSVAEVLRCLTNLKKGGATRASEREESMSAT